MDSYHEIIVRENAYNSSVMSTSFMRRVRRKKCFQRWKKLNALLRNLYATDLSRFPWVLTKSGSMLVVGDEVETACALCPGSLGRIVKLGNIRTCKTVTISFSPSLSGGRTSLTCHRSLVRPVSRKTENIMKVPTDTTGDEFSVEDPGADSVYGRDVDTDCSGAFAVGTTVFVERRMWSGINRPGGVGRIMKVHVVERSPSSGGDSQHSEEDVGADAGAREIEWQYDVKYVVEGGRENRIDAEFVSLLDNAEATRGRNVKGRCRVENCNSFIRDCGHVQPSEAMIDKIRDINSAKGVDNDSDGEGESQDQLPVKGSLKRRRNILAQTNSLSALPNHGQQSVLVPLIVPTARKRLKKKKKPIRHNDKADRFESSSDLLFDMAPSNSPDAAPGYKMSVNASAGVDANANCDIGATVQNKAILRTGKSQSALALQLQNMLNADDSAFDPDVAVAVAAPPFSVAVAAPPFAVAKQLCPVAGKSWRPTRVIADEESQEDDLLSLQKPSTVAVTASAPAPAPAVASSPKRTAAGIIELPSSVIDIDTTAVDVSYPPTDVEDSDNDLNELSCTINLRADVEPDSGHDTTVSIVAASTAGTSPGAAASVRLETSPPAPLSLTHAASLAVIVNGSSTVPLPTSIAVSAPAAAESGPGPVLDLGGVSGGTNQIAKMRKAISHVANVSELVICMSSINSVLRNRVRNCSIYVNQLNSNIGNKLVAREGARVNRLTREERIDLRNQLVEKEWEYQQFRLLVETNTIDVFEAFRKHKSSLINKLKKQSSSYSNPDANLSALINSFTRLECEHDALRGEWRVEDAKVVRHIDRIFLEGDSVLKDDYIFDDGESDDDNDNDNDGRSDGRSNVKKNDIGGKGGNSTARTGAGTSAGTGVGVGAGPGEGKILNRSNIVQRSLCKQQQHNASPARPRISSNGNASACKAPVINNRLSGRSNDRLTVSNRDCATIDAIVKPVPHRRNFVSNPVMFRSGNINSSETRCTAAAKGYNKRKYHDTQTMTGGSERHELVSESVDTTNASAASLGADVSVPGAASVANKFHLQPSASRYSGQSIIPTSVLSHPSVIHNRFDTLPLTLPTNHTLISASDSTMSKSALKSQRADYDVSAFIVDDVDISFNSNGEGGDADDEVMDDNIHSGIGGADDFIDVCLQSDGHLAVLFSAYEIQMSVRSTAASSGSPAISRLRMRELSEKSNDFCFEAHCSVAAHLYDTPNFSADGDGAGSGGDYESGRLQRIHSHLNTTWAMLARKSVDTAVLMPVVSDSRAVGKEEDFGSSCYFNYKMMEASAPVSSGSAYSELPLTADFSGHIFPSPSLRCTSVMEVYLQHLGAYLSAEVDRIRWTDVKKVNRAPLVVWYQAGFTALMDLFKEFCLLESASTGARGLRMSRNFWSMLAVSCIPSSSSMTAATSAVKIESVHLQRYKASVMFIEFMTVQCHILIEWWWYDTATTTTTASSPMKNSTGTEDLSRNGVLNFLLTTWYSLVDVLFTELRHEGSVDRSAPTSSFFVDYLVQHLNTLDYVPAQKVPDDASCGKSYLDISLYGVAQQFFNLWYVMTEFFGNNAVAAAGLRHCGLTAAGDNALDGPSDASWNFLEQFIRQKRQMMAASATLVEVQCEGGRGSADADAYWKIILVHSRVLICLKRKQIKLSNGGDSDENDHSFSPHSFLPPTAQYSPYFSCRDRVLVPSLSPVSEKIVSYNIAAHWSVVKFLVLEAINAQVLKYLKASMPLSQKLRASARELKTRLKKVAEKQAEIDAGAYAAAIAGHSAAGTSANSRVPHSVTWAAKVKKDELAALQTSVDAKQDDVAAARNELDGLLQDLHENLVQVIYNAAGVIVQLIQGASWGVQEGKATTVIQLVLDIATHVFAVGLKRPITLSGVPRIDGERLNGGETVAGAADRLIGESRQAISPDRMFFERVEAVANMVGRDLENSCPAVLGESVSVTVTESAKVGAVKSEEVLSRCTAELFALNCADGPSSDSGSFIPITMSDKRYASVKRYVCDTGADRAASMEETESRDVEFARITQKGHDAFSGNIVLSALVAMFRICTEVSVEVNARLADQSRCKTVEQVAKYFKRDSEKRGFMGMLHQLKATVISEPPALKPTASHSRPPKANNGRDNDKLTAKGNGDSIIYLHRFQSSGAFMCYLFVAQAASALQSVLEKETMFHTRVQKPPPGSSGGIHRTGWTNADPVTHKIFYAIEDHFWKLMDNAAGMEGAGSTAASTTAAVSIVPDDVFGLLNHASGAGRYLGPGAGADLKQNSRARPVHVVGEMWLSLRMFMIHRLLRPVETFGRQKTSMDKSACSMVLSELSTLQSCVSSRGSAATGGSIGPYIVATCCCISMLVFYQWRNDSCSSYNKRSSVDAMINYLKEAGSVQRIQFLEYASVVLSGIDAGTGSVDGNSGAAPNELSKDKCTVRSQGFIRRLGGKQSAQEPRWDKVTSIVSAVYTTLLRFITDQCYRYILSFRLARQEERLWLLSGMLEEEGQWILSVEALKILHCLSTICAVQLPTLMEESRGLFRRLAAKINFNKLLVGATGDSTGSTVLHRGFSAGENLSNSVVKQFIAAGAGTDAGSSWKALMELVLMMSYHSCSLFMLIPFYTDVITPGVSVNNTIVSLSMLSDAVCKSVSSTLQTMNSASSNGGRVNSIATSSVMPVQSASGVTVTAAFDWFIQRMRMMNQGANTISQHFYIFQEILKCVFYQPLLHTHIATDTGDMVSSIAQLEYVSSEQPYNINCSEKWMMTFLLLQSPAIFKTMLACCILPCCNQSSRAGTSAGMNTAEAFFQRVTAQVRFNQFERLTMTALSSVSALLSPIASATVSTTGTYFMDMRGLCHVLLDAISTKKESQQQRPQSSPLLFVTKSLVGLLRSVDEPTLSVLSLPPQEQTVRQSVVMFVAGSVRALTAIGHVSGTGCDSSIRLAYDIRATIATALVPVLCAHKGDTWKNFASDYFGQLPQQPHGRSGMQSVASNAGWEWSDFMEEMDIFFSNCIQRKSGHVNVLASSLGLSDSLNYALRNLPLYIHGLAFTRYGVQFKQLSKWFGLLHSCWPVETSGRVLDCWVLGVCRDYAGALAQDHMSQDRLQALDPVLSQRLEEYRAAITQICSVGTGGENSDVTIAGPVSAFRKFVLGSRDSDASVWNEQQSGGRPLSTLRSVFSLKCFLLAFASPDSVTESGLCSLSTDRSDLIILSCFASTLLAVQCVSVLISPELSVQLCGLRVPAIDAWLGLLLGCCRVHNEILTSLSLSPSQRAGQLAQSLRAQRASMRTLLLAIDIAAKGGRPGCVEFRALHACVWNPPFICVSRSHGSMPVCSSNCMCCRLSPFIRETTLRFSAQFMPLCEIHSAKSGGAEMPEVLTSSDIRVGGGNGNVTTQTQVLSKLLVDTLGY